MRSAGQCPLLRCTPLRAAMPMRARSAAGRRRARGARLSAPSPSCIRSCMRVATVACEVHVAAAGVRVRLPCGDAALAARHSGRPGLAGAVAQRHALGGCCAAPPHSRHAEVFARVPVVLALAATLSRAARAVCWWRHSSAAHTAKNNWRPRKIALCVVHIVRILSGLQCLQVPLSTTSRACTWSGFARKDPGRTCCDAFRSANPLLVRRGGGARLLRAALSSACALRAACIRQLHMSMPFTTRGQLVSCSYGCSCCTSSTSVGAALTYVHNL